VTPSPRYGATVNHPEPAGEMREMLAAVLGGRWHSARPPAPVLASEDFSYYLQHIPGAFALIGADDSAQHRAPCHSSRYQFNDALIPHVARVFTGLAGAPVLSDHPTSEAEEAVN